jgi:hypothetical protein
MDNKHSRLGIASFGISIIVGCLMLALFIVASVLNAGHIQHGEEYPGQTMVGLVGIALLAADVIAVGLGIAALCQTGTRRLFGILGLTFSSVTIVGAVGLIIIGLIYASRFTR